MGDSATAVAIINPGQRRHAVRSPLCLCDPAQMCCCGEALIRVPSPSPEKALRDEATELLVSKASAALRRMHVKESLADTIVGIDGNISAGKSTFMERLAEYLRDSFGLRVHTFPERVPSRFLKEYNENRDRFSFAFQVYMLSTCINHFATIRALKAVQRGAVYLVDRTVLGNMVFERVEHKERGAMDDLDHAIYESLLQEASLPGSGVLGAPALPDVTIYLRAEARTACFERMHLRGRSAEVENIVKDYLVQLQVANDRLFDRGLSASETQSSSEESDAEPYLLSLAAESVLRIDNDSFVDPQHVLEDIVTTVEALQSRKTS